MFLAFHLRMNPSLYIQDLNANLVIWLRYLIISWSPRDSTDIVLESSSTKRIKTERQSDEKIHYRWFGQHYSFMCFIMSKLATELRSIRHTDLELFKDKRELRKPRRDSDEFPEISWLIITIVSKKSWKYTDIFTPSW